MDQAAFITRFQHEAEEAGRVFELNPIVILAQAALESGWGESVLARVHHNLFGLTAYGTANAYWHGGWVSLRPQGICFRKYRDTRMSFLDYGRLIHTHYPGAAAMSFHPEAFAKEIAYSRYITEVNGDDREAYRKGLVRVARQLTVDN